MFIPPHPSESDLQFVCQLGVSHVYTWVDTSDTSLESLVFLRRKVESTGLILNNVGNIQLGKNAAIHLALPGRDEAIIGFSEFLRNLGEAGIHTTTFTWEPAGVHSTTPEFARGGASARAVDMAQLANEQPSHQGIYTHEEIWKNFEYFLERVLPVAEEAGVKLALHPNDPPVPDINGIPCLIHNTESYRRAFKTADSEWLGMEFCCGCWLEGGENFGNILEDIRYFVRKRKVLIVHFRNISAPLPAFVETFLDDGYMDMKAIIRVLEEENYDGTIIYDHTPSMAPAAGPGAAAAYAIGYMKGLINSV
jgi:mannonate dehydratase